MIKNRVCVDANAGGENSLEKKKTVFLRDGGRVRTTKKNCLSSELYSAQLVQCYHLRAQTLGWQTGIKDTNGTMLVFRSRFFLPLR